MRVFIVVMPFPALPNALNLNVHTKFALQSDNREPSSTIIYILSYNIHASPVMCTVYIRYTIIEFILYIVKYVFFTVRAVNKLLTSAVSSVLWGTSFNQTGNKPVCIFYFVQINPADAA